MVLWPASSAQAGPARWAARARGRAAKPACGARRSFDDDLLPRLAHVAVQLAALPWPPAPDAIDVAALAGACAAGAFVRVI